MSARFSRPAAKIASRARRVRGWRPQAKTRALLEQVDEVLELYADHLPLTVRQIFYSWWRRSPTRRPSGPTRGSAIISSAPAARA